MSARARYWQQKMAEFESSGLSRAAFCRRRRINYQTMTYWVKRLRDDDIRSSGEEGLSSRHRGATGFVEVELPAARMPTAYEVFLGGDRSIRVDGDFDGDVLSRLIRTIESC
jgi:hypothetical protein